MKVVIGVNESSTMKLARRTWVASCGKMGDEKVTKRVDAQKVEGKWRRGRSKLQWGMH